jgi:hypothetical protein
VVGPALKSKYALYVRRLTPPQALRLVVVNEPPGNVKVVGPSAWAGVGLSKTLNPTIRMRAARPILKAFIRGTPFIK